MFSKESRIFLRGAMLLIGSSIGVGVFGLPYVFAQSGFGIAIIHLMVVAGVNLSLLLMYADILRNTREHPRFTSIVKNYLGSFWSYIAALLLFLGVWGAMIAYIIIGGEFLHALLGSMIPFSTLAFQLIFFGIASIAVMGGLLFTSKIESTLVFLLFITLIILVGGSLPHIEPPNLVEVNLSNWAMPFGVILFAFGGFPVIPEMAEVLGRYRRRLPGAIITAVLTVAAVYLAFSGVIVAVTGPQTTQEAIQGLGSVVGNWVVIVGSIIGLISVFTSFVALALSNISTFNVDYKIPYLGAWFITISVPVTVFLLGARDFIGVIGVTGSIFVSSTGLLIILLYERAKGHVCLPKRCLVIPTWVVFLAALVMVFGIVSTFL